MEGLVTKFYKKHGKKTYGFICGIDGESYYFSGKSLLTEVKQGDEVKFRGRVGDKGNYALDVQALDKEVLYGKV